MHIYGATTCKRPRSNHRRFKERPEKKDTHTHLSIKEATRREDKESNPRMTWIRASYFGWARKMTRLAVRSCAASRVYAQITSLVATQDRTASLVTRIVPQHVLIIGTCCQEKSQLTKIKACLILWLGTENDTPPNGYCAASRVYAQITSLLGTQHPVGGVSHT